ncbi:hypothetical protein CYY_003681 [Polysphondylium violaceum]|uniref:Acyl-coenzyme A oxidase n=1 Tax=Polysphondylium violaceum TaxID=133409 RepID=A0A8J4V8G5_9MYCE|nr:hypothetical protein CYY_003681 [Polysphondylium violaceum]
MDKSFIRRIDNTINHLISYNHGHDIEGLHGHPDSPPSAKSLRSMLDGEFHFDRDRLRELFQTSDSFDEVFLNETIDIDTHREIILKACKEIMNLSIVSLNDMQKNPKKFVSWFESISYCDPSVALKFAVQYNLWGGTILFLGTKKHHDKYLKGIENGTKLGVFGLTELGHGSNVNGLETTATFDSNTCEFIINSPTFTSQKYWPGNIAKHGQYATIFARLIIKGQDKGIHAFVVPIRSEPDSVNPYGVILPGVHIRDIGLKASYNGIDNGGLLFKNVRIPLDNMLDKFSHVDQKGVYHSTVPANRHFGLMMSVFFIGRVCLSVNSLCMMKVGLSIAVNYASNRAQFAKTTKTKEELPIINYTTTQRRLIPSIARAYAMDFSHKYICDFVGVKPLDVLHSYSSGFKAITSWEAVNSLQMCREVMGGQGFRMCNRVAMLRDHADVVTTGEGDNTVLTQQVGKFLLGKYQIAVSQSPPSFTGELSFINSIETSPVGQQLTSISYQQWLLEKREHELLKELHSRMYGSHRGGSLVQPNTEQWFHLWNQSLPLVIKLVKANVDRLAQNFFLQKIIDSSNVLTTDKATLTALKNLCRLDSLKQIQLDLGFFVAKGFITGEHKWIQIEDEINHLCSQIVPYIQILTEAFGVPLKFNPLEKNIE